ncbi:MAG: hypothetical protein HFF07_02515 [Oscillospiraceae bacterium]|nr:hypothetical protein [Oscillospiraceae bacterium]
MSEVPLLLLCLALSAGLQWLTLRNGRRHLRWLTLLPIALVALLGLLCLPGAYSSFYTFISTLEIENALLAFLSLMGLYAGTFALLLLPLALLWPGEWGLGWLLWLLFRKKEEI